MHISLKSVQPNVVEILGVAHLQCYANQVHQSLDKCVFKALHCVLLSLDPHLFLLLVCILLACHIAEPVEEGECRLVQLCLVGLLLKRVHVLRITIVHEDLNIIGVVDSIVLQQTNHTLLNLNCIATQRLNEVILLISMILLIVGRLLALIFV